jgi:hypothetical protein
MNKYNPQAEKLDKPEKAFKKPLREVPDEAWSSLFEDSCFSLLGSKPFIVSL